MSRFDVSSHLGPSFSHHYHNVPDISTWLPSVFPSRSHLRLEDSTPGSPIFLCASLGHGGETRRLGQGLKMWHDVALMSFLNELPGPYQGIPGPFMAFLFRYLFFCHHSFGLQTAELDR